jgi:hypothetical protein
MVVASLYARLTVNAIAPCGGAASRACGTIVTVVPTHRRHLPWVGCKRRAPHIWPRADARRVVPTLKHSPGYSLHKVLAPFDFLRPVYKLTYGVLMLGRVRAPSGKRGDALQPKSSDSDLPQIKILTCWNTLPDRTAAHCMMGRINELVAHGWLCRLGHFAKDRATLWVQRKLTDERFSN